MEPKLVQHEGGTTVGVDVRTRNQEEMQPGKGRIPSLWERFFREGIASRLQDKVQPERARTMPPHWISAALS